MFINFLYNPCNVGISMVGFHTTYNGRKLSYIRVHIVWVKGAFTQIFQKCFFEVMGNLHAKNLENYTVKII